MKSLVVLSTAASFAATLAIPAVAATGQPVPGKENVLAVVQIDNTVSGAKATYDQRFPQKTTPFVLTRGISNAVHGLPSNPVFGGVIAPWGLDASNALIPANTPFNLLDPADRQAWDKKSFAYSLGNGASFSVGVAMMEWRKQATASYTYTFEHINQTAQPELLSPISLHIDRGTMYLVPTFFGGGDSWSFYTDVQISFTHTFKAFTEKQLTGGGGWADLEMKGNSSSAVNIDRSGIQTSGSGQQAISFPPGSFDREGSTAFQNIPAQTLTVPQFDLLPGQRLSVSLSMQVSAYIDGLGPAPLLFVVAGDPLSLTSGNATPNFALQFAPIPEPAGAVLLLAGLVVIGLHRRIRL